MTGRGIDQVLPHPGDGTLHERHMPSAEGYVELAEMVNGPIHRPVAFEYVWGDALDELGRVGPDARIINLETAVTASDAWLPKGINYRMNPANVPVITAAEIDCCLLGNNHVLDWGEEGLTETLDSLTAAGLATAGAGRTLVEAEAPAVVEAGEWGRVIVFSAGTASSGIPPEWAAAEQRPGVSFLSELSERSIQGVGEAVARIKRPGDVVVFSVHWGGNWGYEIPREHRDFAHGLIDEAGVDLVHGHSSHHVKGIEVYRGKLVLDGCGDFLNDYEGIIGYERYRDDLALMYFPSLDASKGRLAQLEMVPLQIKRFRLHHATTEDARWLADVLNREGQPFGTGVDMGENGRLLLRWG